jgi:predicted RNA-binding Zn-ribbon protein involved in translation (DUF1610 family)
MVTSILMVVPIFYDDTDPLWIKVFIAVVCLASVIACVREGLRSGDLYSIILTRWRNKTQKNGCRWLVAHVQPSLNATRWHCPNCGDFADMKPGRQPKQCRAPYRRNIGA